MIGIHCLGKDWLTHDLRCREHHAGMLVDGVTISKMNKIRGVIASGQPRLPLLITNRVRPISFDAQVAQ
jgi:hypothetical protein